MPVLAAYDTDSAAEAGTDTQYSIHRYSVYCQGPCCAGGRGTRGPKCGALKYFKHVTVACLVRFFSLGEYIRNVYAYLNAIKQHRTQQSISSMHGGRIRSVFFAGEGVMRGNIWSYATAYCTILVCHTEIAGDCDDNSS